MNTDPGLSSVLAGNRIIAILRGQQGHRLGAVVEVLAANGIRALEITLPTPGSLRAIRDAVTDCPAEVHVGAGTVLSVDDVTRAADAGATFIVTPNTDPVVIERAVHLGMQVFPGALTPTEILAASRAGCTAVKVFPARAVGPQFFTDLSGPLPHIPLVAVGGVALNDIQAYLHAGAAAVGLGSPLIGDALEGGSLEELGARAAAAVRTVA